MQLPDLEVELHHLKNKVDVMDAGAKDYGLEAKVADLEAQIKKLSSKLEKPATGLNERQVRSLIKACVQTQVKTALDEVSNGLGTELASTVNDIELTMGQAVESRLTRMETDVQKTQHLARSQVEMAKHLLLDSSYEYAYGADRISSLRGSNRQNRGRKP